MKQKTTYMPKGAIVKWIHDTTKIPISDIKELSTGVHLCFLLKQLTNGKFKVGKVNKTASSESECFKNLRIFNQGLQNCQLSAKFDIDGILKKSYPILIETGQKIYKMFKDAKKIPEFDMKKAYQDARKNRENRQPVQEPKKTEQSRFEEGDRYIQMLDEKRSKKKPTPRRLEDDIEEKAEPQSSHPYFEPKIEQPSKCQKEQVPFCQNQQYMEPKKDSQVKEDLYPNLDGISLFSKPLENPFKPLPSLFLNNIWLRNQTPAQEPKRDKQPVQRQTPEFSQAKRQKKAEDDEQLLGSPGVNAFSKATDQSEIQKRTPKVEQQPVMPSSTKLPSQGKNHSRSKPKQNPLNQSKNKSRQVSPQPNPERRINPSPVSSATTNLLDLSGKRTRFL